MADEPFVPTSSYSDPFYDRLDRMAQHVRQQWVIVLVVVLLIIFGFYFLNLFLTKRPAARSAGAYLQAAEMPPGAAKEAAMAAIVNGDGDMVFRFRAALDLTEIRLRDKNIEGAERTANQALVFAKETDRPESPILAQLNAAAVQETKGNYQAALDLTQRARLSAAAFPVLRVQSQLNAARLLDYLGRHSEAVSILEPLLTVNDPQGLGTLANVGVAEYWRIKRQLAFESATSATSAASAAQGPAPLAPAPFVVTPMASPATTAVAPR